VPLGQHSGVAFTPVGPPSRQRSRVVIRQHSSDSVIGDNTIRMVTLLHTSVDLSFSRTLLGKLHFWGIQAVRFEHSYVVETVKGYSYSFSMQTL